MAANRSRVLVTGGTGQVGRGVARLLAKNSDLDVVAASRDPDAAGGSLGVPVVRLDLDRSETIGPALEGVERLFILTGYSVDMLRQSKSLIDQARRSGVRYIVHLGACGDDDTDVAHYGWHQFVERYIEWSGIGFTHLRPEVFLQNLFGYAGHSTVTRGVIRHFVGRARQCWIDVDDISEVAAACLVAPERHMGQTYRLGSDVKNLDEIAAIMAKILDKPFRYEARPPEEFLEIVLAEGGDPAYMDCVYKSFIRLGAEGIPGSEETFGNFTAITGRQPTLVEDFVRKHAERFDY